MSMLRSPERSRCCREIAQQSKAPAGMAQIPGLAERSSCVSSGSAFLGSGQSVSRLRLRFNTCPHAKQNDETFT